MSSHLIRGIGKLSLLACTLTLASAAQAQASTVTAGTPPMSARNMVDKSTKHFDNQDETAILEMILTSKSGSQRKRRLTLLMKEGSNGLSKNLITFRLPPDIRGTSLLTHEQKERDDDQWLYLPALRKTKRISSSDKGGSFVGSDFSYADLRAEELDDFDYKHLGENAAGYLVEATPRATTESDYSKRVITLQKGSYFITHVDFYDKKGQLLKTLDSTDLVTVAGNLIRANQMIMKNVQSGHMTNLKNVSRQINTGLADNKFTKAALERGGR